MGQRTTLAQLYAKRPIAHTSNETGKFDAERHVLPSDQDCAARGVRHWGAPAEPLRTSRRPGFTACQGDAVAEGHYIQASYAGCAIEGIALRQDEPAARSESRARRNESSAYCLARRAQEEQRAEEELRTST